MNLVRCFIACSLPARVIDDLRGYQGRVQRVLADRGTGFRWASPASFHLTLHFLGEIEEPLVSAVGDALREEMSGLAPFGFRVEGIGCFPSTRRARVLWAGAQGEGLTTLHAGVQASMARIGLPPEKRPFHSHITLGRLKPPLNLDAILAEVEQYPPGRVQVEQVMLFSSRLTPKGAIYQALRRAELGPTRPHAREEEI